MATEVHARQLKNVVGWRLPYLIATWLVGWRVVDIFDGLFVVDETPEHWFEAAFLGAVALVYLVLAWWRPLPAGLRILDGLMVALLAAEGATLVLRATLPDAAAFRGSLVLAAAILAASALVVQRFNRVRSS